MILKGGENSQVWSDLHFILAASTVILVLISFKELKGV